MPPASATPVFSSDENTILFLAGIMFTASLYTRPSRSMRFKYFDFSLLSQASHLGACRVDAYPHTLLRSTRSFLISVSRVVSVLSVKAPQGMTGHYATWQSAVEGFGDMKTLAKVIEAQFYRVMPRISSQIERQIGEITI